MPLREPVTILEAKMLQRKPGVKVMAVLHMWIEKNIRNDKIAWHFHFFWNVQQCPTCVFLIKSMKKVGYSSKYKFSLT